MNLISLRTPDLIGCKWLAKVEILKVIKKALIVMKNKRIGNLYELLENIITCGSIIISSQKNNIPSSI